jgi:hypothetical protein
MPRPMSPWEITGETPQHSLRNLRTLLGIDVAAARTVGAA